MQALSETIHIIKHILRRLFCRPTLLQGSRWAMHRVAKNDIVWAKTYALLDYFVSSQPQPWETFFPVFLPTFFPLCISILSKLGEISSGLPRVIAWVTAQAIKRSGKVCICVIFFCELRGVNHYGWWRWRGNPLLHNTPSYTVSKIMSTPSRGMPELTQRTTSPRTRSDSNTMVWRGTRIVYSPIPCTKILKPVFVSFE